MKPIAFKYYRGIKNDIYRMSKDLYDFVPRKTPVGSRDLDVKKDIPVSLRTGFGKRGWESVGFILFRQYGFRKKV